MTRNHRGGKSAMGIGATSDRVGGMAEQGASLQAIVPGDQRVKEPGGVSGMNRNQRLTSARFNPTGVGKGIITRPLRRQ